MPNDTVLVLTPAASPPPGVQPNLEDPPKPPLAVSIVTYAICLFLVLLAGGVKVFTNVFVLKSARYEDCKCSIQTQSILITAEV